MPASSRLITKVTARNRSGRFVSKRNLNNIENFLARTKLGVLKDLSSNIEDVTIGIGYSGVKTHYSGLSYGALASILENGTRDGRIPARPYLERASQIVIRRLKGRVERSLRNIFLGNVTTSKVEIGLKLTPVAEEAVRQTKRIIFNGPSLGIINNRLKTIQDKGFNKPWVRTGDLVSNLEGFIRIN